MTSPKGTGPSTNQSGTGDMSIPRLGEANTGATVIQPGEDPAVIAAGREPDPFTDTPVQANGAQVEALASEGGLAALQAQMDVAAKHARNRPVFLPQGQEQRHEGGRSTVEMPDSLWKGLDSMNNARGLRPDQMVEPVADMMHFENKAAELAFQEQLVMVRIHETSEKGAENPVVLGVNGRNVAIYRGHDTIVRRKFATLLFRCKPESMNTRVERDGSGNPKNFIDKNRALKFPFDIVRDDDPRGRRWAQQMRMA